MKANQPPDFQGILSQLVSTNPNEAFSYIEQLKQENLVCYKPKSMNKFLTKILLISSYH